jgi:hypothetical protein
MNGIGTFLALTNENRPIRICGQQLGESKKNPLDTIHAAFTGYPSSFSVRLALWILFVFRINWIDFALDPVQRDTIAIPIDVRRFQLVLHTAIYSM